MIKTALVGMTLLGCDCDAKVCEFVADAAPKWESIASCEAAIRHVAASRADLDYPLLTGQCRVVAQPEPEPAAPIVTASQPTEEPDGYLTFVKSAGDYVASVMPDSGDVSDSVATAVGTLGGGFRAAAGWIASPVAE